MKSPCDKQEVSDAKVDTALESQRHKKPVSDVKAEAGPDDRTLQENPSNHYGTQKSNLIVTEVHSVPSD